MLATHAIKARVAASKWMLFGHRKLWLVYGTGQTIAITAKVGTAPEIGDELLIIDVSFDQPILGNGGRLYANFEEHDLKPEGGYAVWLSGCSISKEDVESGAYECMSIMVNDWFTFVEDEIALTLLVVKHGGTLIKSNHLMTRL